MTRATDDDPIVIYLDVDGVVTTTGYQRRSGKDALDPAEVGIVADLVRELGAKVVVSSTWRVDDCRPTLVAAGLPPDCFHDDWRTAVTDRSRDPATGGMLPADEADRGGEVSEHVRRNGVSRYLVLDDVDVGPEHAGRHVRPDPERGLTVTEAASARALAAGMIAPDPAGPILPAP